MRNIVVGAAIAMSAIVLITVTRSTSAQAADKDNDNNGKQNRIELYDNCDSTDTAWNASGGCKLDPKEGDVRFAEFNQFLTSSLAVMQLIGHPSWRVEPSYMTVRDGAFLHIENEGGRDHTFTEVANFGGGRIAPLNQGQMQASECALPAGVTDPRLVKPGASLQVGALGAGLHKFQCCIHPWMRVVVRVDDRKKDDE